MKKQTIIIIAMVAVFFACVCAAFAKTSSNMLSQFGVDAGTFAEQGAALEQYVSSSYNNAAAANGQEIKINKILTNADSDILENLINNDKDFMKLSDNIILDMMFTGENKDWAGKNRKTLVENGYSVRNEKEVIPMIDSLRFLYTSAEKAGGKDFAMSSGILATHPSDDFFESQVNDKYILAEFNTHARKEILDKIVAFRSNMPQSARYLFNLEQKTWVQQTSAQPALAAEDVIIQSFVEQAAANKAAEAERKHSDLR